MLKNIVEEANIFPVVLCALRVSEASWKRVL